jgi:hypothetical protein
MDRLAEAVANRIRRGTRTEADGAAPERWPALTYSAARATLETLHLWTQIVGKTRLALAPAINHWWHVTLYPSARGLSTSAMPCGARTVEIEFDLIDQKLLIRTSHDESASLNLQPGSVADFYRSYRHALAELDITVPIWPVPVELPDHTRFDLDERAREYDPEYARTYWQILSQAEHVLQRFRNRFLGKASPVHFFWGSFDLAHTRFSGRPAPPHPGGLPNTPDFVTREAYSHECWSCGFWNGNAALPYPAFYAYAYPAPDGFPDARVQPAAAYYDRDLGEFILPYDAVCSAERPAHALLSFMQQTYEAAANAGGWQRHLLERPHE